MYRVRVRGLPGAARTSDVERFFGGLSSLARVQLFPKLGQAAVSFTVPEDAVQAAQVYHGRFGQFPSWRCPQPVRRLEVLAETRDAAPCVVREVWVPEEPTRENLKTRVHRDAVGGQWPFRGVGRTGVVSYKNRIRRYKPPGNPKPRHG